MSDDSNSNIPPPATGSPGEPGKTADPWFIDGLSAEAVARAESEAARRGMSLAEWLEEAIERALIAEKAKPADPPAAGD